MKARRASRCRDAIPGSPVGETSSVIRRTLLVGTDDLTIARGALVCRDLPISAAAGPASIRRGTPVDDVLLTTLARQPGTRLTVVLPEEGELAQGDASLRFARAIVGSGLVVDAPHQGQCIVRAETAGVLRVQPNRVVQINRLATILLATALDGRVVDAGDTVAVVKATQLWTPAPDLHRSLSAAGAEPVLRLARFTLRQAAFLAGPRLRPANVAAASENLRGLLSSYGLTLATQRVDDDPEAISRAYRACVNDTVEMVLVGGSIALDPGDPFLVALDSIGARLVCRGAPVDPGTMFWVANVGSTIFFGLASCELYGRRSVLDLLLPYAAAGEPITQDLLAELGYGGLLEHTLDARHRPRSS